MANVSHGDILKDLHARALRQVNARMPTSKFHDPLKKVKRDSKNNMSMKTLKNIFHRYNSSMQIFGRKGFLFIGCGVSDGEDDARFGTYLMPKGSKEVW
ncbi:19708_t:CDS:2 [Funneliformis geosporum]|nr:19708_t:CDS:2 [Funneliformis geosporum]